MHKMSSLNSSFIMTIIQLNIHCHLRRDQQRNEKEEDKFCRISCGGMEYTEREMY